MELVDIFKEDLQQAVEKGECLRVVVRDIAHLITLALDWPINQLENTVHYIFQTISAH